MGGEIKTKYTTKADLTITLAALGVGPLAGRESNKIDNSAFLYVDVLLTLKVESGTVTGNKSVFAYVAGSTDGGSTFDEFATGVNAAFTRQDPTNLKYLGTIYMPSNATIYQGTFSVANAFGGTLPEWWNLLVFNDSGAPLSGTAGNNKASYQGAKMQYT